ncbi:hypothetical protein SS1G_05199 [Sclerotinia sclerotiorum 1980 UF-70]|uniref:Uncharacterized protein n=1 Tax=Sclerotinia sclerotiorum (strain ATCC 18683 / 1980 / Ss-1) TaxID=665079 RepID=A7EIQ6_SCLS1|nr:hypothetical protein SS1G_05199 [Sclerotinia sclerotiorum 1980 UF-70]EDO02722.1 hypothetical protein SS1G_05199 [Sclerotinia sclerotiorum 1980 UF-70]
MSLMFDGKAIATGDDDANKTASMTLPHIKGAGAVMEIPRGRPFAPMLTADAECAFRTDNHAWLSAWKNESIFQAGPSKAINWYRKRGTGSQTAAGLRASDADSMCGIAIIVMESYNTILYNFTSSYHIKNYYSIALLMLDGRIFTGGRGLCGSSCATYHDDAQIDSPAYLSAFNRIAAIRTAISSVTSTIAVGVPPQSQPTLL